MGSLHFAMTSLGMLQIKMAPSEPVETTKLASGLMAAQVIVPLWPTPMYSETPLSSLKLKNS